ncbi:metalloprotease TldD [Colwellia sp. MB02u-18]|uniref:metalloprotease TldD n=1 Tax=unclassified Colwellia TaxID=196834 RepID=UPI0015F71B21|nr:MULTISPECIES: metalloprotease TldD [unclassified Colwellia]MBA6223742.1 metalloprotease TldD [Colwellia sp. MB3u-45]MBA6268472.1 metalloprotease TldD [Colwellia sp. MB3u-43]MBA6297618.1 metalloprotease TldD [Colwellia sp. MB02u-9]MBA6319923.1 metalloprotease TldD [Colwellia sp. MB02u-19]MBA6324533.1 metalloprotease TldD [Colwellia sp. MB02u-18]
MNNVEIELLANSEIDQSMLMDTLDNIFQRKVDLADLYFQSSSHESWMLEDGIVKEGSYNIERGVGVRAISGEKTGFAYSDDISPSALKKAADAAKGIANAEKSARVQVFDGKKMQQNPAQYQATDPLASLPQEQKITLLHEVEAHARSVDKRVKQVIVNLSGIYEKILVAASDGTYATDIRPLVRLNCSVLVEENGKRERASSGGGARTDYSYFFELEHNKPRYLAYAEEAVRQALVNLVAIDSPAGLLPVVLGAGWPGVLLHEAVGHGLEGDFNRKGSSAFSGKIGQKVTSDLCTIVDDGTMANRRGSISIDDEGTPGQYNVLIEKGVLKGYMQDKHNAGLMGVKPTGNGRRESYAHLPMPRMTNTYMLAGEHKPEDIIKSVKKGIYAPNFAGGQVDITSGKFVFTSSEAYLIENGEITSPIKGATLIGSGPEAMKNVSMVGNDLKLDAGVGVCGKDGQSLPVGVGQPTLKIDQMTVGGTQ